MVVDAVNFEQRSKDKYVGALVKAQIAQADMLVLSKTGRFPHFQLNNLTPADGRDTKLIETILNALAHMQLWQAKQPNYRSFLRRLGIKKRLCRGEISTPP